MKQSILNINVSSYRDCNGVLPKDVNLLTWLSSDKYRDKVEQIRKIQDEDLQKEIKMTLPAITPSGLFFYRKAEGLLQHSGFIAFDVDLPDNLHITNFDDLRTQISHIVHVAYCGLSVRGKGYWGLVPIPPSTPEEHKWRFDALRDDFRHCKINLDPSGSDVCRLRIYSWDPDAYFNPDAKLYSKIKKPRTKSAPRPSFSDTREGVENIIHEITIQGIDITQGHYKDVWFKLGAALANEFGEGGRDYFHAISKFHPEYTPGKTDRQFDHCLKHNYDKISIGSFFHIAGQYIDHTEIKPAESADMPTVKPVTRPEREKVRQPRSGVWDAAILELEQFFTQINIPNEPIRLDGFTLITDPAKMINAELSIIKYQNGNKRYLPDLERLQQLKQILSS